MSQSLAVVPLNFSIHLKSRAPKCVGMTQTAQDCSNVAGLAVPVRWYNAEQALNLAQMAQKQGAKILEVAVTKKADAMALNELRL